MSTTTMLVPDAGFQDRKIRLSTLWVFATLNYLYCDVLTLMDPAKLRQFLAGRVGGMDFTQGVLLASGVLMEIPIAMILLSRLLKYRTNRVANLGTGLSMTAVQIATLFMGSATAYYWFFSIVEIGCTSMIVWYAWNWVCPTSQSPTASDQGESAPHPDQAGERVS